jgi:hypothetical protein
MDFISRCERNQGHWVAQGSPLAKSTTIEGMSNVYSFGQQQNNALKQIILQCYHLGEYFYDVY